MTIPLPRRAASVLLALAVLGGGLTACSAAEDRARSIAGTATDSASAAALAAVTDQACTVVADGDVSRADVAVLGGLVDAAQAAGADSSFLTALEDVTGTDGTPPESAAAELIAACASQDADTAP